ncbi:MAG: hypothetical protein JO370_16730 [Paucibacter sp.]|nr:hypothetical protein [Roseateles sp.]
MSKVCGRKLLAQYEQSREDLKQVHAQNYDNLRKVYERQALDCVVKEYKKCTWRGSLFAKDVLKHNKRIFPNGVQCITIQLSDKGIYFMSNAGHIRPLVGYDHVSLHLNDLITLLDRIIELNKIQTKKCNCLEVAHRESA